MTRLAVVVAVLAILVLSCGTPGEGMKDKPPMSRTQALARIEQLVNGTADAIQPRPRLELYRPSLNEKKCVLSAERGLEGLVVSRTYYLDGIPADQIKDVARQVKDYWTSQGHVIEGISEDGIELGGRSRPDDFLLALSETGDKILGLGVTSPCVLLDGTPT